ncbi:leucine-rich repeat domain-containing protein [Aquimarina megaterium]|uniref:leucine-rich repeat domain-containing protein n=1 Tax=Aquimarina megaterium TaxID=1443666 RepID=UPI0009425320|nr:leucine-rich repeat domain-containing protein [Aquimarina megaterium]
MKNLKLLVILLIGIIVISCSSDDDTTETTIVIKDFKASIDENPIAGVELGAIEATTNQGTLMYTIKTEEPSGAFVIDAKSGKLTVKDATLFDFETRTSLTATVQVKNGDLSKEAKVIIVLNDVNDAAITIKDFKATIDENPTANQDLGTIEATTDQGELTYSLIAEEPSGALAIDATGKLTVKDATLFDYETRTTLTATVQIKNGEQSKEAKVTVMLNNVIESENIVFPDINFKNALLAHTDPIIDTNTDGEISIEEALVVEKIDVSKKKISNLSGIEYFAVLTYLDCSINQLTSLDISKNTELTYLDCSSDGLTSLDMSKTPKLTHLDCAGNQLTSLDMSKNTKLINLLSAFNQLTSIDVSKNTALTRLDCYENQLTSLDVSKNTMLTTLSCSSNQLTSLDVSQNSALTILWCNRNKINALDVSKNTMLATLVCAENQISSLDISQNTTLTKFHCYYNQLTFLNMKNGKNDIITEIFTYQNLLTCIQVDDPDAEYLKKWVKDDKASYASDCTR